MMQVRRIGHHTVKAGVRRVGSRSYLFPLLLGGLIATFFCLPWSFEHKAHAYLHGLCAQRPSHSLIMGELALPFDARMTGIYGGFLVTSSYLLLRGRFVAWRLPDRPVLAA